MQVQYTHYLLKESSSLKVFYSVASELPPTTVFFLRILHCEPALLEKDLPGHVYLVTGGNSGVGRATAAQLFQHGAHVVLGCRRIEAGEEAAKTFMGKGTFEVLKMDLGDMSSIRDAAKTFLGKHDRLDELINNAGTICMFSVSHFGHFLLTELLLNVLKRSAPSRVICLSSVSHAGSPKSRTTADLDDLKWENREHDGVKAYEQSKLANLLHARELAKRLDGTGVTVASVHSGWVQSNLVASIAPAWIQNILMLPFSPMLGIISNEDGVQASLNCILDDEVSKQNGEYYSQNSILYSDAECRPGDFPMKSPNPTQMTINLQRNCTIKVRRWSA